jgi:hypothetical protein
MYTLFVLCDLLEETAVKAVLQLRYLNMIKTSVTEDSKICRNAETLNGAPKHGSMTTTNYTAPL